MNKQDSIDDLFRLAREQKPQASFNETKDLFLTSLESKVKSNDVQKKKVFTFKNGIIMSTLIGILITISIFFTKDATENKKQEIKLQATEKRSNTQTLIAEKHLTTTEQHEKNKIGKRSFKDSLVTNSDFFNIESQFPSLEEQISKKNNISFSSNSNEEYIFPKLTEEEIKKTLKQKKKMLKTLAKLDNDYFSYVPTGSFKYQGEMNTLYGFYIQKMEVSNLEYRTYLFDLLIQGKKEEFLKAKPDQHKWVELLGESYYPMETQYFSNEGYNDYPVNNISREGAELYCKWLYEELLNYVGQKTSWKYQSLRLPFRQEWVYAASWMGNQYPYAFDDSSLFRLDKFFFYKANFNVKDFKTPYKKGQIEEIQLSTYYPSVKIMHNTSSCTWKFNVTANGFGLYNLNGNVAEMVIDGVDFVLPSTTMKYLNTLDIKAGRKYIWTNEDGTGFYDTIPQPRKLTPGTAGGGWMNSAEEIKTLAPDNHPNEEQPHPNIGFRFILTYSDNYNNNPKCNKEIVK